jgi:hypothetical protein
LSTDSNDPGGDDDAPLPEGNGPGDMGGRLIEMSIESELKDS